MYLEIIAVIDDIDVFVGPFKFRLTLRFFRAYWERRLSQVEFFPHKCLPEGKSAILPKNFRNSKEFKISNLIKLE